MPLASAPTTDADTIVIGSGAGGLTAAVALANSGQKVLVLEQYYLPGGWCHSFALEGYRSSPGVHDIGELGAGGRMRAIYEGLGRPDACGRVKATLLPRMIAEANRIIPGLADRVVFADLGTPLTNVFYCAATFGNLYGTEKSRWQGRRHLFLAGAPPA